MATQALRPQLDALRTGLQRKIGGPAGTSRSAADRGGARTDAGGEHSPGGRVDPAQDVVRAAAARDAGGQSRGDADGGTLSCAALEEQVSQLEQLEGEPPRRRSAVALTPEPQSRTSAETFTPGSPGRSTEVQAPRQTEAIGAGGHGSSLSARGGTSCHSTAGHIQCLFFLQWKVCVQLLNSARSHCHPPFVLRESARPQKGTTQRFHQQ